MNPLLKKEIRLLLPGVLVGAILISANLFVTDTQFAAGASASIALSFSCVAAAVFIALNSFGAEMSAGTLGMLLTQPVARDRIWRIKTRVLAAVFGGGGGLWYLINCLHYLHPGGLRNSWELLWGIWLLLAVVYSGALWTVLLFRQMAAAFWFTLLTPVFITVAVGDWWPENHNTGRAITIALLIYSGTGFWYARRLFLKAQDVQWTGGTIVWPEMRWGKMADASAKGKRGWRPRAALVWKEVQLHQSAFVFAGVLLVLHLAVLAARAFGTIRKNSIMEMVVDVFWYLWLVLPMMIGATAMAEERKLGTLAGQLSLPVKWRSQFAFKLGTVLLLSVLFGAFMPLLLESWRILPGAPFMPNTFNFEQGRPWLMRLDSDSFWHNFGFRFRAFSTSLPLFMLAGTAAAIGAVSFYASTLARNTLQALAPAVLINTTLYFWFFNAGNLGVLPHSPVWRSSLIHLISLLIGIITLIWLSAWNSRRIEPNMAMGRCNALGLAAAVMLVMIATPAIYHRTWEKLTPFEPAHGAAQFSRSNPPELVSRMDSISVRFGDGRIWTYECAFNSSSLSLFLGKIRLANSGGRFYSGSNWLTMVSANNSELVGLKMNGALWEGTETLNVLSVNGRLTFRWKSDLKRFGSDTNWSSVAPDYYINSVLLVKTDGTLWRWGPPGWIFTNQWPGLSSFTPQRLGTESNWLAVTMHDGQTMLRSTNGSLWATRMFPEVAPTIKILETNLEIQRMSGNWRSTTASFNGAYFLLSVGTDGTFRIRVIPQWDSPPRFTETAAGDLQLGRATNWLAVAGNGEQIVTLKDDGSLWLWNFHSDKPFRFYANFFEDPLRLQKPVRLGIHADWIAIATAPYGIISLAADGSLWYWPLASTRDFDTSDFFIVSGGLRFEPLLEISRKPQLLGNLFK